MFFEDCLPRIYVGFEFFDTGFAPVLALTKTLLSKCIWEDSFACNEAVMKGGAMPGMLMCWKWLSSACIQDKMGPQFQAMQTQMEAKQKQFSDEMMREVKKDISQVPSAHFVLQLRLGKWVVWARRSPSKKPALGGNVPNQLQNLQRCG